MKGKTAWKFSGIDLLRALPFATFLISTAIATAYASRTGNHPWLGLVAFLPLLRLMQVSKPLAAMFGGGSWGVVYALCSGAVIRVDASLGLTTSALLVLVPAAFTAVGALVTRRIGFSPFVVAVLWMLFEFALRPVALHNGLLAGTLGDNLIVRTGGHLFGYAIVAFLICYASALLLNLCCKLRFRPPNLIRTGVRGGLEFEIRDTGRLINLVWFPVFSLPRPPPACA